MNDDWPLARYQSMKPYSKEEEVILGTRLGSLCGLGRPTDRELNIALDEVQQFRDDLILENWPKGKV